MRWQRFDELFLEGFENDPFHYYDVSFHRRKAERGRCCATKGWSWKEDEY
jgi:hypothetical protein